MVTVTVEEMQKRLPDLLNDIKRGEDILITEGDLLFARLMPVTPKEAEQRQFGLQARKIHFIGDHGMTHKQPRQSGSGQDQILYIAEDFDEPLEFVESRELRRLQEIERNMSLRDNPEASLSG